MAKQDKETKGGNKHFWKDFKAELKKVIWPTPKQIVNNTATVIGIVLLTVVIVFILDLAFDALNTYGINKLKSVVNNETTVENSVDANNSEENLISNETSTDENADEAIADEAEATVENTETEVENSEEGTN